MQVSSEAQPRVMIVDDTPANLAFLSDALEDAGYQVLVALNGMTALRQLDLVRPDLILLDAIMPGLDGFQICERLKARDDTRAIPVIFMTALTDTADVVRGFDHGAVDYLTKPVREAEVLARIAAHLGRARDLRRLEQRVSALAPAARESAVGAADHGLTAREAEVLEWVAAGKTNRDIAAILDISPRTVTKHLERIFVKLGVETRTAAARHAVRM
jgi:DNA-binding response OmpR family regulator